MLLLIGFFALVTLGVNARCSGDACIAAVWLALITWAVTGAQLFVAIPVYALSRERRKQSSVRTALIWVVVSLLPAFFAHWMVFWRHP